MKKPQLIPVILTILLSIAVQLSAQVSVSTDNSSADPSAMLDVKSTNKGVVFPRMTQAQISAISNPTNGLVVFCTTDNKMYIFVSSSNLWKEVSYGTGLIALPATYSIGIGGSCNNTVIHGNFVTGAMLIPGNYVTIQVSVTIVGSYAISTNSVNGYSFSGNGIFSSTGIQTVNLMGNGTPIMAQTDTFSATPSNGGGICSFSSTVLFAPPCNNPITDSRDGKIYNIVLIGTQCWMAQNLNIGVNIVGSNDQTNNSIIEKYCMDNNLSNCNTFGGLYQWDEAMQYSNIPGVRGICPTGWHMPTDSEWTTLTTFLGGENIAGGKMKEAGTAHWPGYNSATNSSGFTALPAGIRYFDGNFYNPGTDTYFWSSSQYDVSHAWERYLWYGSDGIGRNNDYYKSNGLSIRCLKD